MVPEPDTQPFGFFIAAALLDSALVGFGLPRFYFRASEQLPGDLAALRQYGTAMPQGTAQFGNQSRGAPMPSNRGSRRVDKIDVPVPNSGSHAGHGSRTGVDASGGLDGDGHDTESTEGPQHWLGQNWVDTFRPVAEIVAQHMSVSHRDAERMGVCMSEARSLGAQAMLPGLGRSHQMRRRTIEALDEQHLLRRLTRAEVHFRHRAGGSDIASLKTFRRMELPRRVRDPLLWTVMIRCATAQRSRMRRLVPQEVQRLLRSLLPMGRIDLWEERLAFLDRILLHPGLNHQASWGLALLRRLEVHGELAALGPIKRLTAAWARLSEAGREEAATLLGTRRSAERLRLVDLVARELDLTPLDATSLATEIHQAAEAVYSVVCGASTEDRLETLQYVGRSPVHADAWALLESYDEGRHGDLRLWVDMLHLLNLAPDIANEMRVLTYDVRDFGVLLGPWEEVAPIHYRVRRFLAEEVKALSDADLEVLMAKPQAVPLLIREMSAVRAYVQLRRLSRLVAGIGDDDLRRAALLGLFTEIREEDDACDAFVDFLKAVGTRSILDDFVAIAGAMLDPTLAAELVLFLSMAFNSADVLAAAALEDVTVAPWLRTYLATGRRVAAPFETAVSLVRTKEGADFLSSEPAWMESYLQTYWAGDAIWELLFRRMDADAINALFMLPDMNPGFVETLVANPAISSGAWLTVFEALEDFDHITSALCEMAAGTGERVHIAPSVVKAAVAAGKSHPLIRAYAAAGPGSQALLVEILLDPQCSAFWPAAQIAGEQGQQSATRLLAHAKRLARAAEDWAQQGKLSGIIWDLRPPDGEGARRQTMWRFMGPEILATRPPAGHGDQVGLLCAFVSDHATGEDIVALLQESVTRELLLAQQALHPTIVQKLADGGCLDLELDATLRQDARSQPHSVRPLIRAVVEWSQATWQPWAVLPLIANTNDLDAPTWALVVTHLEDETHFDALLQRASANGLWKALTVIMAVFSWDHREDPGPSGAHSWLSSKARHYLQRAFVEMKSEPAVFAEHGCDLVNTRGGIWLPVDEMANQVAAGLSGHSLMQLAVFAPRETVRSAFDRELDWLRVFNLIGAEGAPGFLSGLLAAGVPGTRIRRAIREAPKATLWVIHADEGLSALVRGSLLRPSR